MMYALNITRDFMAHKAETAKQTTKNITYFVNSTTGSDSNDGLTESTAFKTIQHAIEQIPQIVNHVVNICLAPGVYNENLKILGFLGKGVISIVGNTSSPEEYILNGTFKVINTNFLNVSGLKFIAPAEDIRPFFAQGSIYLYINICIFDGSAGNEAYGIYARNNTVIFVNRSEISNFKSAALGALWGAQIISNRNNGSGNSVGLSVDGGVIRKLGTQPSGTTEESIYGGGEIV